jgi:ABC-type bacteriocin/lantibiotic exporter with double-glycine peptidase domain
MNQDASKPTIIGNFMLPKFRFQRSGQTGSIEVVDISSELTFEPMILSFHQICYEVKIPGIKDPRILLSNVSGFSKPHALTALMGSSGAGKTTLLDVLAGRKTTGRITGDILINGYPKVQDTFARISG